MSSLAAEPRRPRLLGRNRKLRHLRGIWLRNLSFAPTSLRTADDAELGTHSGRSPSKKKLGVLRESSQLHPSRSTESLRSEGLRQQQEQQQKQQQKQQQEQQEPRRPQGVRRTSLSLAHVSPAARQRKLEAAVEEVVGDVFYSLHVDGEEEPVYLSEVRERSANFNFRFFTLADHDPSISRSSVLTIRVWAKRPKHADWIFLLEEHIDLRRLNFIGTLRDRRFPPNALVFHLEDGIYSIDFPNRISDPKQAPSMATSSYNALMKLANLESSIEDAMETQQRIMKEINDMLEQTPVDTSSTAQEAVSLAEKYIASQRRANHHALKKRDDLRASLSGRRAAIQKGRELQATAEEEMVQDQEKLKASKEQLEKTEQQIRGQRRRICSDLADVFPITPLADAPPLSFQICNLPLPNSTYDAATARQINEDVLSAALGHVSLLTRHLQFYLAHPLPYPIDAFGSRSYVRDDISQLPEKKASRRDFPLYLPRGGSTAGQWRFEYAWFLLNKDVEALCSSQGLRVVDIRHSLPNLKYLLYVCSAGTEDVPERRKGGVRGLWAGRIRNRLSNVSAAQVDGSDGASIAGSRRGSNESEAMHAHGDAVRRALLKTNGNAKDKVVVESLADAVSLPFGEGDAKFTLRTRGLRENVSR